MENDSIRPSGTDTLVDIWIDGKMRSLCVSQQAIGAYIGFDQAKGMSERDRCEFVRTNLALVVKAAKERLRDTDVTADNVALDVGQLPRADGVSGDRRKVDRRKTERRKASVPRAAGLPDRRRGDRRQGQRRTPPKAD